MRLLVRLSLIGFLIVAGGFAARDPSVTDGAPVARQLVSSGEPTPRPRNTALEIPSDPPIDTALEAAQTPDPTPHTHAPTAQPTARSTPHVHPTAAPVTKAAAAPAAKPKPAATAKPTAKPQPKRATPPPNSSYSVSEVKAQIRQAWGGNDDQAVNVVGCETGGTYDPRTTGGGGSYLGLWQFTQGTWERWGGSGDPRDASPAEQTRVAYNLYQKRGWEPWPACGSKHGGTPAPSDGG